MTTPIPRQMIAAELKAWLPAHDEETIASIARGIERTLRTCGWIRGLEDRERMRSALHALIWCNQPEEIREAGDWESIVTTAIDDLQAHFQPVYSDA